MDSYNIILQKLNRFNQRYYTQMLIRGLLLSAALGLLVLLAVAFVEYLLWLPKAGRLILFIMAVGSATYLLVYFVLRPVLFLFRFREGITHKQASLLIGRHFPEVKDKLFNLFDLAEDGNKSELLLASIEQRSHQLTVVPFSKAIDLTLAFKNFKYLIVPVLILLIIWFSGRIPDFLNSYNRVLNYEIAYQPPAPFVFESLLPDLDVLEDETVTVQVRTRGAIRPENISIIIDGRDYLMQEEKGTYYYTFQPPLQTSEFYFRANGINSERYMLRAMEVPVLDDFTMELVYPDYLKRPSEVVKSTGNGVIPEGTLVRWMLKGRNVDSLGFKTPDTVMAFHKTNEGFTLSRRVFRGLNYEIGTTNKNVRDYEVLRYQLNVIRDANPEITVQELKDSLDAVQQYFTGEVSDDYLVTKLEVTIYPEGNPEQSQSILLMEPGKPVEQFYYLFPSGFDLQSGVDYELFFTVTDNDGLRNGKSVKSRVFRKHVMDETETRARQLNAQEELIRGLGKSLDQFQDDSEEYDKIKQKNKEKKELNFRDQKDITDFLDRQKRQEAMMEKFSRELKENLQDDESSDEFSRLLQERLERKEMEAKKNAKLLDELKRMADKIDKEELTQRLEELGKQRQNNERNLEQILELTKRYYVTEKASQLSRELDKLGDEQNRMAEDDGQMDTMKEEQEKLLKKFEQQAKEIEELLKENNGLKWPLELNVKREDSDAVKRDQQESMERLNEEQQNGEKDQNSEKSDAQNKTKAAQRRAGNKMKEMSKGLQQSASGTSDNTMVEDAEMLRQILDNLITFSFKQETLFEQIERQAGELANYSREVRDQQELRVLFQHIDDSLFTLSLRRPEISDLVNEQITEVYYNMDKALESISEDRIYQGVSQQQYVLTAANTLADFLASILDNMQQSLAMGSGSGSKEQGFQLPDIIQSQGQLKEKAGEMGKDGQKKSGGKEGKDGGNSDDGEKGKGMDSRNQEGNRGQGDGSEGELRELYEIYKQQQQIRQALEEQLKDLLEEKDKQLGARILKEMEEFENELLERGITEQGLQRLNRIEHELLKMENATLRQGEKETRESRTNSERFTNPVISRPGNNDNYKQQTELLNRQALPLQRIFQEKVKNFFKENDSIPLSD